MKKVVFGITSLHIGGAERVLVDLTSKIKTNYDITILTLYPDGELLKSVDKDIKVISVFKKFYKDYNFFQKKLISLCFLFSFIRKIIYKKYIQNKYDVEIAFLEGPITSLFSHSKNKKLIAWVHNDIELVFGSGIKADLKRVINEKIYSKYKKLIFVSQDNLEKFKKTYSLQNEKQIIYNYIDIDNVIKKSEEFFASEIRKDLPSFIVVARLVEQKGIERLIKVHKKLVENKFLHRIYVVGEGPLKASLTENIIRNNISKTFLLLGQKNNPYPYIKEADFFMLPSLYEGYGMVIIEARILNKQILITDTAAREAIADYKKALIIPNSEDGIYEGIKTMLKDKNSKVKVNEYSNSSIINDIIQLIES